MRRYSPLSALLLSSLFACAPISCGSTEASVEEPAQDSDASPIDSSTKSDAPVDASHDAPQDSSIDSPKDVSAQDSSSDVSLQDSQHNDTSADTTAPLPLGGFQVTVTSDGRLVVSASDGRPLLDGLPLGSVSDQSPPLVGFALQDKTTDYEMMFGAFKPKDTVKGPWIVPTQLVETATADGKTVDLRDKAGALLAKLVFKSDAVGHLAIQVQSGAGPERQFSWGFACNSDDHFAGFGAQTWDTDHRGQSVPTWVQEEGIGKLDTDTYTDTLWYTTRGITLRFSWPMIPRCDVAGAC